MKSEHRERSGDDVLVDALLSDEGWKECNDAVLRRGISAVRTQRRRGHIQRWATPTILGLMLGAAGVSWFIPTARTFSNGAASPAPSAHSKPGRDITEEQMLAMFPRGSCVIAEVNGQRQLMFFDRQNQEKGFLVAGGKTEKEKF